MTFVGLSTNIARAASRQDFTTNNQSVGTGNQLNGFSRRVGFVKPAIDNGRPTYRLKSCE